MPLIVATESNLCGRPGKSNKASITSCVSQPNSVAMTNAAAAFCKLCSPGILLVFRLAMVWCFPLRESVRRPSCTYTPPSNELLPDMGITLRPLLCRSLKILNESKSSTPTMAV